MSNANIHGHVELSHHFLYGGFIMITKVRKNSKLSFLSRWQPSGYLPSRRWQLMGAGSIRTSATRKMRQMPRRWQARWHMRVAMTLYI